MIHNVTYSGAVVGLRQLSAIASYIHMSYLGAPEVLGQLQLGQLQLIKWLIMLRYIYIQLRRDSREVKGSSRL